jgi:hypothetical protein
MWIIDPQRKTGLSEAQLYVTTQEARELRDALDTLLADPEADEHEHVGMGAEFSISIVTPRKLRESRYTSLEQRVLAT